MLSSSTPNALFAYGTPCFPEVLRRVCGQALAGERAVLPGHRCRLVHGESFPAVLPDREEDTPGLLYQGITDDLLHRLDLYEGEWYQRVVRTVRLASGAATAAWVYLLAPDHAHRLSSLPWDPEMFRRHFLAGFLASCPAD